MEQEKAFVRAILKAPNDRTLRLIFADWLDEHGDPRGEYIRAAVMGKRVSRALKARREELRKEIDPGWLPLLDRPPRRVSGWLLEINPEVSRAATVAATLEGLHGPAAPEVFTLDLAFEGAHNYDSGNYALHFSVFVNGDRACVEFEDFDGHYTEEEGRLRNVDNWRSRNSTPSPQSGVIPGFLGHPAVRPDGVDIHLDWTIPRADALLALAYHYVYFGPWRGGATTFAPWVVWERCAGYNFDSPPPPTPWQPRGPAPPTWSEEEDDELNEPEAGAAPGAAGM
jgi:uncharacterized protein (TIGR02996 family)